MSIPATYPNAPAMATVFQVPTSDQYNLNPNYWDAYKAEQARITQDVPSATNIVDFQTYRAVVLAALPPAKPWDAASSGKDNCITDVAYSWEWEYNPLSGRNKVF